MTGKNIRILRETCINNTLFTINPTWTGLGSCPNFGGERPATNSLANRTAHIYFCMRECGYIKMVSTSDMDIVLTTVLVSC